MIKVRCILQSGFNDIKEKKKRVYGEEFEVTKERAKYLENAKAIEILEIPIEETEKKALTRKKKIDTKKKQ